MILKNDILLRVYNTFDDSKNDPYDYAVILYI
jgi:hypothetical protein